MKLFACQHCGQLIYFENVRCERCGHALGYLWRANSLAALMAEGNDGWSILGAREQHYRYCANARQSACNWLIPVDSADTLCRACRLNRTIPNLQQVTQVQQWQKVESAKHRLIYALLRLGLPVQSKQEDAVDGLAFDFLDPTAADAPVMTGHADGVITINLNEADDAERERQRQLMGEPYRTLLGHLRHEVGHYYWARMAQDPSWLAAFRAQFGDERANYAAALQAHYQKPPADNWQTKTISAYATAHPWEDWAETFSHYLHIVDTLETAYAFGIQLQPQIAADEGLAAAIDFDAYSEADFDRLINAWFPVTHAVNSLNRSMGQPDLYPFVLSPAVIEKLRFVHSSVRGVKSQEKSF